MISRFTSCFLLSMMKMSVDPIKSHSNPRKMMESGLTFCFCACSSSPRFVFPIENPEIPFSYTLGMPVPYTPRWVVVCMNVAKSSSVSTSCALFVVPLISIGNVYIVFTISVMGIL